jgi:hypothetical protein
MKSRAKTAQSSTARKTLPPPAGRKSVPPPAARKSVAPQARKSVPPPAARKGKAKAEATDDAGKRRLGMRGSAPWAARHAQKHAEEATKRNLEPPKPGSARGTLRTPDNANDIKLRISDLHNVLVRIRSLRKNLQDTFYQVGTELKHVHDDKLYEAKGFSSFEAFAERELELGRATAVKLSRVPSVFLESAARQFGMDAALAALDALDEHAANAPQRKAAAQRPALPLKPPR